MKKPSITFLVFLILAISCNKDHLREIQIEIPFDEFWMSTKFSNATTDYFNTWALLQPHLTTENYYSYYASDELAGVVPPECSRTFVITNGKAHGNVSCSISRQGTVSPNDGNWLESLEYEIEIIGDTATLQIEKALLKFNNYDSKIDFKNECIIFITDANGYPELILMGGSQLLNSENPFEIYLRCVFTFRL